MATVSGGYKVNAAVIINNTVTRTASIGTTSGVWYTAPANGFAILTVALLTTSCTVAGAGGSATAYVNGTVILSTQTNTAVGTTYLGGSAQATAATGPAVSTIYLGPGQTLDYNLTITSVATGTLNATCRVFGVEYINA
jgi:hypothetical protein